MLTKEFLIEHYTEKKLRTGIVAKIAGCSSTTVLNWLHKFGISVRSLSEINIGKKYTPEFCRRLSESCKGINRGSKSVEHRRRLSQANIGKFVGDKNPRWVEYGYKFSDKDGYVWIKVEGIGRGWVYEHRWLIEGYLGRCIQKGEIAHHINKIRYDNRIENLMLFSSVSAHQRYHRNPSFVKPEEIVFDGRDIGEPEWVSYGYLLYETENLS